jgi:hypothetical protein
VWPSLRWAVGIAFCLAVASIEAAASTNADAAKLIEALDAAASEEEGAKVVEPYLGELKKLAPQVVEKVVLRQWWGLARDIVAKSHTQQVDLSFSIRKAVRTLKDEADELLRTLNPKYGQAQQVAPAFQWAQNDTCILLTVKFTVRWNAPGALEVTEPAVVMSHNSLNFTGLGKHSNNKYKYVLLLDMFDNIVPAASSWNTASVGKLSVTLKKKWARKWPRLLANKKTKIGNMHVWMEMQDRLDSSLGGMATVSNSPVTCGAAEKLYCLATDTCKKPANCSQCPGKSIPLEELKMCGGMPTEKAGLSFKDDDMDEHELGGPISITKARNEFDIDHYAVYWGKDDRTKLELEDSKPALIAEAAPTGSDTHVDLRHNTKVPEQATHLLVFSKNSYGEYATPGFAIVRDAYNPKEKPKGLLFHDEDGDKNEASGTVTVERAADEKTIDDYALHWGKSATRRIASSSHVRDIPKETSHDGTSTWYMSRNTKIPDGATHLLLFSKNEHGEHPSPAALKVVDNTKPCVNATDNDCVVGLSIDPETEVITVERAKEEKTVTDYVLYYGRKPCSEGDGQSGAKNGHIKDLPVDGSTDPLRTSLEGKHTPDGTTHILVFSKNSFGESEHCKSVIFKSKEDQKEL